METKIAREINTIINGEEVRYTKALALSLKVTEQKVIEALDEIDRMHEREKKEKSEGCILEQCPTEFVGKIMLQIGLMGTLREYMKEEWRANYINTKRKDHWSKLGIKEPTAKIKRII